MSQGVIDGFEEAVNEISQTDIRALLIRAEGPHFMGGADVHIFEGKSAAQARAMFARRCRCSPGSRTAAAHRGGGAGLCLAAGLEVALTADIVVAASPRGSPSGAAHRHHHPARRGTAAGGARRIARAKQIVFDGDQYSAQQFADWNIINHVVPDDELRPFAERLARRYAAGPTRALAAGRLSSRVRRRRDPQCRPGDPGKRRAAVRHRGHAIWGPDLARAGWPQLPGEGQVHRSLTHRDRIESFLAASR